MKELKYGFFKDGKIYRKGFLNYPDKEIGEIRDSEEATVQYFANRFEIAANKIKTLENEISEAENKGSYLMKLIHLRTYLSEFDGLGDFVPLYEKLDELEKELRELISANRVKNLEIKRALLVEAEEAEKMTDLREATDVFADIRERWIKTGSVEKEYEEETEGRFTQILNDFFEKKRLDYEKRKAEEQERVKQYERLIAMADRLRWERDKPTAMREMKKLQSEWRGVGRINKMKMNQLWRQFKSINDFVFRKNKPARLQGKRPFVREGGFPRENFEENIKKKEQLIFLVDQLKKRVDDDAVREVKRLQDIWKTTGKVPPDKFKELSGTFFRICDEITELNYLEKNARSKSDNYDEKSAREKLRIKIQLLEDQISRDEEELEPYGGRDNRFNSDRRPTDKALAFRVMTMRRKLSVKKKILSQLNRLIEKS